MGAKMLEPQRRIDIILNRIKHFKLKDVRLSSIVKVGAILVLTASFAYAQYQDSKTPETFIYPNTLTVVSLQTPDTIIAHENYKYGFAYDILQQYAKQQKLALNFKIEKDNHSVLRMVKNGKADIAISSIPQKNNWAKSLVAVPLSCANNHSLNKNGIDPTLTILFNKKHLPIKKSIESFVCNKAGKENIHYLASFYTHTIFHKHDWTLIKNGLSERLPLYVEQFKQASAEHNIDWHLLAAIGYQESALNAKSVSPTGVRGLMMLTQDTAKEMGITNRNNAAESIQGGSKYFKKILNRFKHIPEPERFWFALVSYNMGPDAVRRIQNQLKEQGKDPYKWINLYAYLLKHQAQNPRYLQAIQYVSRIRLFFQYIEQNEKMLTTKTDTNAS